jgi:hypothetical protein
MSAKGVEVLLAEWGHSTRWNDQSFSAPDTNRTNFTFEFCKAVCSQSEFK